MCGLKLVTASLPMSAGPLPVGQLAKSLMTGQEPVLPPAEVPPAPAAPLTPPVPAFEPP